MNTIAVSPAAAAPAVAGWRRFSLVRIVLGMLCVVVPTGATMFLVHQLVDKSMRGLWPQLLAAALCVAGYRLYVHKVERRGVTEFGARGAGRELGAGLGLGAAMFLAVIGILAAAGTYRVSGGNGLAALLVPSTELILVALFEEILFRGVLQRNIERALGTWPAVVISAVVFGLAHIPNANATAAAIGVTVVAGLLFAAAYLATRRLWLAVGMHFAWNFMSDAIFSVTTPGHAGKGVLVGDMAGPSWLAGGGYGVEASVVTLVVLAGFTLGLLAAARRRGTLRAGKDA